MKNINPNTHSIHMCKKTSCVGDFQQGKWGFSTLQIECDFSFASDLNGCLLSILVLASALFNLLN